MHLQLEGLRGLRGMMGSDGVTEGAQGAHYDLHLIKPFRASLHAGPVIYLLDPTARSHT
jgi:hypothetical protein